MTSFPVFFVRSFRIQDCSSEISIFLHLKDVASLILKPVKQENMKIAKELNRTPAQTCRDLET